MLNEILALADHELLRREVEYLPIAKILLTEKSPLKDRYVDMLIAYYGHEIFHIRSMRQLVLTTLPLTEIKKIDRHGSLASRTSAYDASLTLSESKWEKGEYPFDQINEALQSCHNLTVPDEYVPAHVQISQPVFEDIIAECLPELFDYQKEISEALTVQLNENAARAMLQMPTGSGKTRTVMHAIIRWLREQKKNGNRYVMWLAHNEELCEQAIDTFKRSWLEYGAGVFRYYRLFGARTIGDRYLQGGIIFATLQKTYSLINRGESFASEIAAECDVLVFDEAHKALAPTYKQVIDYITSKSSDSRLIGLSATPGRSALVSDENRRLAGIFNNNLIGYTPNKGSPIGQLQKRGILAKIHRKEIRGVSDFELSEREKGYLDRYMDIPPSALQRLGENMNRNNAVVDEIISQNSRGNQSLIFTCSVEHAKLLAAMLRLREATATSITSEMRRTLRAQAIEDFRNGRINNLTNYGILTTGFDAPTVGAIFITRPTSSIVLYSQMIGRGMRGPKVGGKNSFELIDVVDNIEGFGGVEEVYNYFNGYWN